MKEIDLIIPYFNSKQTLPRLFGSILSQTICDKIHIILVDDCSNDKYDNVIKDFSKNLDIEVIKLKSNVGPGATRRIGMQKGKSPYIMFMDSDDTLYNAFSASALLKAIKQEGVDFVYSDFFEEVENEQFVPHEADIVWVFGKIYKRDFLEKNNIYFNDTRQNEDNGFNTLVDFMGVSYYLHDVTYIWHYNKNSITRKDNSIYTYTCIEGHVDNKIWAFKEGLKRNVDINKYNCGIIIQFCTYYFTYFFYLENPRDDFDNNLFLQWIRKFYYTFKDEIQAQMKADNFRDNYQYAFNQHYNNTNINYLSISLNDFIKLLEE